MNQKGLPLTTLYIILLIIFLFQVRNPTLTLRKSQKASQDIL